MNNKVFKKLTLLLVLVMLLSLFTGFAASGADGEIYLAFSSDVHYNTTNAQNNLELWLGSMEKQFEEFDFMGFCGDTASAYASTNDLYWEYTQAVIDTADKYTDSGFLKNGTAFIPGNHEWYPSAGGDMANYLDHETVQRFIVLGEAIKTDDYIVYAFGPASGTQEFLEEDIAVLGEYLSGAPKDIPIIVLTHYPLHYFSSRASTNADKVIEVLNNYPNVIFLWGHNHTLSDPYYDRVFIAGEKIAIESGVEMDINFTYSAAGCMSDSEYGAGSHFVNGKGLVLAIDGGKVAFSYYDYDGQRVSYNTTVDVAAQQANPEGPFTVTFKNGMTGDIISEQTVEADAAATAPVPPEYDDYLFSSWSRSFDKVTKSIVVTAHYELIPEPEQPLSRAAALGEGYVYINLAIDGEPAVGKTGNAIVQYPIKWERGMTVGEAVTKLHELEHPDGADAVAVTAPYGLNCFTKFWGVSSMYGTYAFNTKTYLDALSAVNDGDVMYLAYDTGYKATSFITPDKVKTAVGIPVALRAQGMILDVTTYAYSPEGFTADILTGTTVSGASDTGVNSDSRGYFNVSFSAPGTYYVLARSQSGTVSTAAAVVEVVANRSDFIAYKNTSVTVNGAPVGFGAYSIDGYDYFKLRDIALALNGTASQFSVKYDEVKRTINCVKGEPYAAVGGELTAGTDNSGNSAPSTQYLAVNRAAINTAAFNIGGNNYYRLNEIAAAFGFKAEYDAAAAQWSITSSDKIEKVDKGDPVGTAYLYAVTDSTIHTDGSGTKIAHYPVPLYAGDTVADAVSTLHEIAFGDAGAWGYDTHNSYGYILTRLWGKVVGSTTYGGGIWTDFSEAKHADPTAPAVDGMIIYLNNFTDGSGYAHFRCGYFDKQYAEISAGDELTLTFLRSSGDGEAKAVVDSAVSIDGVAAGSTAEDGSVTLTFDEPGEYLVTGDAGTSWTTGVCVVVVS